MLCEKCKKAEATVHVTEVAAGAPEEMKKRDFCVACFGESDLAKKLGGELPEATSPGAAAIILPNDEPDR
jgi:protein-arginine kinase activator protein McsA